MIWSLDEERARPSFEVIPSDLFCNVIVSSHAWYQIAEEAFALSILLELSIPESKNKKVKGSTS